MAQTLGENGFEKLMGYPFYSWSKAGGMSCHIVPRVTKQLPRLSRPFPKEMEERWKGGTLNQDSRPGHWSCRDLKG